jgi:hypothetical protein
MMMCSPSQVAKVKKPCVKRLASWIEKPPPG